MGLFGKKKEPAAAAPERGTQPGNTGILVLGSGCAKCNALEEVVRAALTELGMDPAVGHVTDFTQIAAYGVMSTPALVVDGKVVSSGKVLKKEEAAALIQKARS
ncbi:thioredoxin family protein [Dysosmobacter sp.]|uniref:thioredoxin family protein n=1 Tax=Dysosmobacter sp. TaxID=2591382 RepID=UPI003A9473E3